MEYTIYTDGACQGNPGPGGYGALVLQAGTAIAELQVGFYLTTNNRMELWAVIAGIEALPLGSHQITFYSDSKYVVDAISKGWLQSWLRTNFKKKKNEDLWRRYVKCQAPHEVEMRWVKGHSTNALNARCDTLATSVNPTQHDHYYENLAQTL